LGRKIALWAAGVAVVIGGAYLLDAVYQSRTAREVPAGSTSVLTLDDGWFTPRGTAQRTLEGVPMSECAPSQFSPAEAMKHATDLGWTYQVVDDGGSEPPKFLSLILHEPNGTEHNVLYFRGKKFCEFFLNEQGAKVRDVERYK
jgi:hypothetical protein